MTYVEQINLTRVPKHIAIIMDGNGRWAKERGLDRSEGHRKGLDVVHEITDAAAEVGVQYLTLYAFSTENWNRPQAEVDALMALVVFGIERETPGMVEKGVRLSVIGDLDRFGRCLYALSSSWEYFFYLLHRMFGLWIFSNDTAL